MDNNLKEIIETAAGILYEAKLIELKDMQSMLRHAQKLCANTGCYPAGFSHEQEKKKAESETDNGIRVHL